jgi:hypothetical protein
LGDYVWLVEEHPRQMWMLPQQQFEQGAVAAPDATIRLNREKS